MSSNVHGLVNVKKCDVFWRFLAVGVEKTRCYRRFTEYSYSHAFSSICRSIIVRKWYLFLYLSVFYTVNHLDIYRYVYYTYMFWWSPFFFDEKKNKKNNKNNKQIMACKPLNAVVCCFKVSFTIKWKKSCRRHSFLAENKKLPHRFTHRLYMCLFFSEDNASDF